jgi:hypothetical protein
LVEVQRAVATLFALMLVVAACGNSAGQTPASEASTSPTSELSGSGAVTSSAQTDSTSPDITTTDGSPATTDSTVAPGATSSTQAGTVAGRTTPVPVPGVYQSVAVVGCSQTRDAMAGYADLHGGDWGIFGGREEARYLSGGSIERWTSQGDDRYWDEFATWNGPETDALWIQVCWASNGSQRTTVDHMGEVVERAFEIIGHQVPVFISGLNDWSPRDMCPRGDYLLSWDLAEAAVAAGYGAIGPDPGIVTEDLTDDGCHGNDAGDRFMGGPLVDFFG